MQGVLDFIQACSDQGFSPTLKQIAKQMNWSSKATAHAVIQSLRGRNLIKPRRKRWQRKISLSTPDPGAP